MIIEKDNIFLVYEADKTASHLLKRGSWDAQSAFLVNLNDAIWMEFRAVAYDESLDTCSMVAEQMWS